MTKYEKALAIAETVADYAQRTIVIVNAAYPKKQIFPKRGRYRVRRKAKQSARINMPFCALRCAARIAQILAEPIYRIPKSEIDVRN